MAEVTAFRTRSTNLFRMNEAAMATCLIIVMLATFAVQTFHMVEHVAQVLQKYVFDISPAHGLVGQLDLEQVHFAFNTVYLILFVVIILLWMKVGKEFSDTWKSVALLLVIGGVMQTYHEVEHTVKFIQYLQTGVQGTPGIAGRWIEGAILHFAYNLVVYVPIAWVFFAGDFHLESLTLLRKRPVLKSS
jgi:hypothetical protein